MGHGRILWRVSAVVALMAAVLAASPASSAERAQASGPPAILSVSVGPPLTTEAIIFLSLNPGGLPTNVVVEYGRSSALGEVTSPSSPGTANTTPAPFSVAIFGLLPATTYYARVVATNSAGSVTSGLLTFATAAGPAGPTAPGTGSTSGAVGTVQVVPAASPGAWGGLSDIACAAGTCLAVGYQGRGSGPSRPLVERWTGSSWVDFPAPTTVGASLYAIACPASGYCLAVGRDAPRVYAAQLLGHIWHVLAAPSPPTPNGDILRSLACVSTRDCWAAGYTDGATRAMRGLLEHWNGRAWSVVADPTPPDTMFNAVACATDTSCWVVGGANAYPQLGQIFVQRLVGSTWVRTGPAGSGVANSVSCTIGASCWMSAGGARSGLLLQLRALTWRATADPGAQSGVGPVAITCASVSSCWAVGYGGALHWGGSDWVATNSGPLSTVVLLAVTCPSQVCLAVGARGNGSAQLTTPTAAVLGTP